MALQQTSLDLEKEDLLEGVKDMKDAGSGNGAREGKLDVGEMRKEDYRVERVQGNQQPQIPADPNLSPLCTSSSCGACQPEWDMR
jgi:hypothetical protein